MKPSALVVVAALLCLPPFAYAQKDAGDHQALLDRLASGDRRALKDVVKKGDAIFPELTKLLSTRPRDDNQSLLTFAVAEIASSMGPKAKEATPILCMLLKSQDKAVASDAVRALGYIGADATPEVLKTLKALEQEAELINAVRALRQIGPGAKGAAPGLLSALKANTNPHFRLACIDALGAIGPSGKSTVEALLGLANDKEMKKAPYTTTLIVALGNQGADAKAALGYLADVVKDAPEPHLRIHALEALAKISPSSKETADAVAKLLDQPHVPKVMVLESLSKGGALNKEMLKTVENMMRDNDSAVRLQAALVIGKTNANHPSVVSILIESLQAKDAKTRRIAAEAIGAVRPSDEAVIEALQSRTKDSDPAVRMAVENALAKFKKK
jgi:HEAT repeat protein